MSNKIAKWLQDMVSTNTKVAEIPPKPVDAPVDIPKGDFTTKEINEHWGNGKPISYKGVDYRVVKLSNGDIFLEPGEVGKETDPRPAGSLLVDKVEGNPQAYEVVSTLEASKKKASMEEKKAYSGEMVQPSYVGQDSPEGSSKKSKNIPVLNSATIEGMDSVARTYSGFLVPVARYALTKILKANNPQILSDGNLSSKASSTDIEVDVDKIETVADSIHAIYKDMVITAFEKYGDYNIMCYAKERKQAQNWMADLENKMKKENQYRGKMLHVENNNMLFSSIPKISWDDVVLSESVKKDLRMNTIAFLGDEKMSKVGVNKRGLILYGLPGTGKSSACRAIFTELEGRGVSRVYVTSESFRRMSAQSLFSFLPFLGKTVIAFEDIDLLGGNRDNMISVNTSLLGDLLTNLDGMRNYDEKIVILASTNKMSLLDDALSRPGRFDRKIEIGLPTEANLKVLYRKFSDLDASDELIKLSKDFTGSHVRETVNTAKILALSEGKGVAECLQEACQIIRDNFFVGQTMSETKTASLTKVSNIIKSRKIVGKKKLSSDKIAEEFIKVMGEEKVREMYKENNV